MAFRRKVRRRSTGRSLETRSHANRAFKKVTRQWQFSLNVKCQVLDLDPLADCPNGGVIQLLNNFTLQGAGVPGANFPDAVRIKRIEGNLYFRPTNPVDNFDITCSGQVGDQANSNVYMRMGLKKSEGPQGLGGVSPAYNPLANGATPYDVSDYADGRWLKLWEHLWGSSGTVESHLFPDPASACCSTQAGYTVPPTASGSQVTYDVPPIVCSPCDGESDAVQLCAFTAQVHRWHKFRIHYGRTIVVKENDNLNLWIGWERIRDDVNPTRLEQPTLKFFGGVRMLLES